MDWSIEIDPDYADWLEAEPKRVRVKIASKVKSLRAFGPFLGRPDVDTVHGSTFANMKELRVSVGSRPYRVLFAFDPKRRTILLFGR